MKYFVYGLVLAVVGASSFYTASRTVNQREKEGFAAGCRTGVLMLSRTLGIPDMSINLPSFRKGCDAFSEEYSKAKLLILVLTLSNPAVADEVTLGYGVNTNWQTAQYRAVHADYRRPLYKKLWHKVGGMYWFQGGGKDGAIATYSLGARVRNEVLYADLYWGTGYLFWPDNARLSGHLQFKNDVGFGIAADGVDLGIVYTHISNAGIVQPNQGMDFLMFQVKINF